VSADAGTPNQALQQTAGHFCFWEFEAQRAPPLLSLVVLAAKNDCNETMLIHDFGLK
jgi:hypothetical protein